MIRNAMRKGNVKQRLARENDRFAGRRVHSRVPVFTFCYKYVNTGT
jgi:hypothetical protein